MFKRDLLYCALIGILANHPATYTMNSHPPEYYFGEKYTSKHHNKKKHKRK